MVQKGSMKHERKQPESLSYTFVFHPESLSYTFVFEIIALLKDFLLTILVAILNLIRNTFIHSALKTGNKIFLGFFFFIVAEHSYNKANCDLIYSFE